MATRMKRGFTLVELLVVIGIIGVLVGILLPALNKARRSAFEARSVSNLRQLLMAYAAYHTDHRGRLMYGYPPESVNGHAIAADDPVTNVPLGSLVAARYPWRLARYLPNLWPILHAHTKLPEVTQKGDPPATVQSKAYTLSLNPTYGLNAAFLGGHKVFDGFVGVPTTPPTHTPNVGQHVAFRANEVRRPTEQIVFADCYAAQAQGNAGDKLGYAYLTPPWWKAARKWDVSGGVARSIAPAEIVGLPAGWYGKNVATGFFDGHAEMVRPDTLSDMRLWAPRATTPEYDEFKIDN